MLLVGCFLDFLVAKIMPCSGESTNCSFVDEFQLSRVGSVVGTEHDFH